MDSMYIVVILLLLLNVSTFSAKSIELQTVSRVDLDRYVGLWYQTAYIPNTFQPRDCGFSTAEYKISPKGEILVHNICWKDESMTKINKQVRGKAFPVNNTNTKLKVQFFWPFKGDYWVIDLDEKEYCYAVVSEPRRKYLWILSRTPIMDTAVYDGIIKKLKSRGFDTSSIVITAKVGVQP